jgi:hypothetical protein
MARYKKNEATINNDICNYGYWQHNFYICKVPAYFLVYFISPTMIMNVITDISDTNIMAKSGQDIMGLLSMYEVQIESKIVYSSMS